MSPEEKLKVLGEKLKKAQTKAERDRINAEVDAILGMESSPEERDEELEQSWERSRG